MKLVCAIVFAILIGGAGSPKPNIEVTAEKIMEDINSLKKQCEHAQPVCLVRMPEPHRVCILDRCSAEDLELLAKFFPDAALKQVFKLGVASAKDSEFCREPGFFSTH